jgi:hypothetical protein
MPATPVTRRGTGRPDSDVYELVEQHNLAHGYWVLNAAIAINSAVYTASAFMVLASGSTKYYPAGAASTQFTGTNLVTGNVMIGVAYITQAGTHGFAISTSAATYGALTLPTTVPSTAYVYGTILVKASGTSAFTGGTTALDGTNASAIFTNLNGPAGIAFQVSSISRVPG